MQLRLSLIVALLCGSSLTGCESVNSILSGLDKPSASVSAVRFDSLSLDGMTLVFDVDVKNPYGAPLPLVNVAYGLSSKGTNFLDGSADVQGSVPARGSKTIQLPARITFASLLSSLQGVRPGSVVPYTAQLGLSVDAPAVGRLTLPLKKEGQLPVPTLPEVELTSVQWKNLSLQNAEAVLKLKVVNTNEFPIDLSRLAYSLSLGGTKIADTSLARGAKFSAGGSDTLEIPLSLKPANLGIAAFNMFTGKGAGYNLAGAMNVTTPFGPMSLPFERKGETVFTK